MPELDEVISAPLRRAVATGSDNQLPMYSGRGTNRREGWQRVITDTLLNWLRNPAALADDGVEPPSGTIIRLALDLAEKYRDLGIIAAPDRVVPDPNGGIVFEKTNGELLEAIHIWDDGTVEYMAFDGAHLRHRHLI